MRPSEFINIFQYIKIKLDNLDGGDIKNKTLWFTYFYFTKGSLSTLNVIERKCNF